MLVEVRPLDIKRWHGKEGKESFAQPKVIEALYDHATGRYATGLTEKEAEEYSKELGVDLSNTFSPTEAHPYWGSKPAAVRLYNHTMIFDGSKPSEYVKIKLMKASKMVANSMREYEEGKWPEATHVIFDEEEDIDLKATKVQNKRTANEIAAKMSNDDKINMIQILSKKSLRGRSGNFIDVEIDSIIEEKAADFVKYAKMGKDDVYVRASVLECLHRGILSKEAGAIYYMGEQIAMDYEDAVAWFKDVNNQKMKVSILEKLNSAK